MPHPYDSGCCGKPAGAVCAHDVHPVLPLPPTPTEEWRTAMCAWLTANGIDPKTVPLHDHNLRITERDGRRLIEYTEYVRCELTGNILCDPDNPVPITSRASTPCLVEPEAWLHVPGARS